MEVLVGANGAKAVWPPLECPGCHTMHSFFQNNLCLECNSKAEDSLQEALNNLDAQVCAEVDQETEP